MDRENMKRGTEVRKRGATRIEDVGSVAKRKRRPGSRLKKMRPSFPRFEALALPVLRTAFPVYVAVVVVLSLLPLAELPGQGADKLVHFAAYGIMALLGMPLVNVGRSRLVMLLAIVAVGAVLEGLQLMLPYRDPSALDLVANCLGAVAGAGLWLVVLRFAAGR